MEKIDRKTQRKKRRNYKIHLFLYRVALILFLAEIVWGFISYFYVLRSKMFPSKFMTIAVVIIILVFLIHGIFILRSRKKNKRFKEKLVCILTCVIFIFTSSIIVNSLKSVFGYMDAMSDNEHYSVMSVIVLNSSGSSTLLGLKNSEIGIRSAIDQENTNDAINEIKGKIGENYTLKEYTAFDAQANALYSGEVDAILLNEAFRNIIEDSCEDFSDRTKVIYKIKVKANDEIKSSVSDMTTQSFNILLSGMDTRGSGDISAYGHSDVNIVASVNPVTKQIVLTNIPRDYYVALNGDSSKMDKLTHAGSYGIESSVKTVEELLDIKIDYYVRVNFTSVVDIVNALGGIEVESEYTFSSNYSINRSTTYSFKKGMNNLNGKATLAFCRERKSLPGGDRDRGKNQEAVIKGILNKITSPAIITNFSECMEAITKNIKTNITTEEMTSLLNMQLIDMASWDILSQSVDGKGGYAVTYSAGNQKLSVIMPDEESVDSAKSKIEECLDKSNK